VGGRDPRDSTRGGQWKRTEPSSQAGLKKGELGRLLKSEKAGGLSASEFGSEDPTSPRSSDSHCGERQGLQEPSILTKTNMEGPAIHIFCWVTAELATPVTWLWGLGGNDGR
jgi:hypothetical protein